MKGHKIEEIKNPPESTIKLAAKSILISRLPAGENEEFKTALLKVFDVYNPHKANTFPTKEYTFSSIEKIRIMNLSIGYYLEGNDIVINDIQDLEIFHEGVKLEIRGTQIPSKSK